MEDDVLVPVNLRIEPNQCLLTAPITILLQYRLKRAIRQAMWEIIYEVDTANARHAISLHQSAPEDILVVDEAHLYTFQHHADHIPIEGVKERHLLQLGVLRLILRDADGSGVACVNMVSQVTKDASNGTLIRNIFNPLDE